ncbi:1,6-anhydro-N-acetylmuramyl-L-alanine amidase AmpD [Kangiella profundi]|uniref:1,6-anhydro-N-acetylmuramyl-L-alanine amidase AmpD n=1 Tax=Kangiella profundi TaxID=1561924 RepID=UPI003570D2D1
MNLATGLIQPARFVPTEHCDERKGARDISLLVIHNISLPPKQFGGPYIDQLFTGSLNPADHPYFEDIAALRVSSHLLIRRNGELVQYVPFQKRAWHAGVSIFEGREKCNDFSIGIELEGADDIPYEDIQYHVLSKVTKLILKAYPQITQERIAGHSDIAPGRKTDPGPAFDWSYYRQLIA